jgi:Flp pilus assembly protein TadG
MAGFRHSHPRLDQAPGNRRRRGSGTLELAFFLMPSLALICGFLDIGMALFTWNTLQNAVREGTRYAITYQVDGSGSQITSIKNVVSTWAMGLVQASWTSSSGTNVPYIDVNFYTPPTVANPNGSLLPATGSANAPGNIVEVSVKNYPYAWMAPFSGAIGGTLTNNFYAAPGSVMRIAVYSADVLGGTPIGGTPPL